MFRINRGAPRWRSTYRTLCVRECDGFYFPLSTTTTESKFRDDDGKCRSQCAAPAELFYHRSNQDVEQMFSLSGRPYSQMPNAFRNRKVYIRGCSCNEREYSREEIAKSEEALKTAKRADASRQQQGRRPDAAFARRISARRSRTRLPLRHRRMRQPRQIHRRRLPLILSTSNAL